MNTFLDGLACNPALPRSLVSRLVGLADGVLALSLARRSDLSAADVQALMALGDPDVVAALLESGWVRPSSVPVTDVWMALVVAEHPDAPPELVRWLAAHPDPVVRARVARLPRFLRPSPRGEPAPALTAAEIRVLVSEQGPSLSAARSPDCPPDLLHLMAETAEEPEVLRAIARHPHASGETLLLCLGDAQARHLAAAHPHLPVPMILKLLGSEFTAGPAASNPSLPVEVMEELLNSTT
ncbi:hypothetical protein UK23_36590 [Lentzea aerocolonigenes]|uniref:Leucine rich repeat variant n=1 Tax=Lentzea aerocolonigenes TaxID=68170 RepID=A0A0F0GJ60_LENAE|nr:hypothetical protein [Lentzea aerocolonigenes]KJK42561.1 hypothetical protein UK23_36590 [Lentzea aerocolonigenes]